MKYIIEYHKQIDGLEYYFVLTFKKAQTNPAFMLGLSLLISLLDILWCKPWSSMLAYLFLNRVVLPIHKVVLELVLEFY